MHGQINDTAQLHGGGKLLHVTGWVRFDTDEKSAVVEVTVTQGGSTVTCSSGDTPNGKKAWGAEGEGKAVFLPGLAHASATATVRLNSGGDEQYPEEGDEPWARYITLVA
jgi:hypothetical protein